MDDVTSWLAHVIRDAGYPDPADKSRTPDNETPRWVPADDIADAIVAACEMQEEWAIRRERGPQDVHLVICQDRDQAERVAAMDAVVDVTVVRSEWIRTPWREVAGE